MPAGVVKLAQFQGGVHVWAALDGMQHMYAVGLDGAKATHCPTQPVLQTVRGAPASSSSASSKQPSVTAQPALRPAPVGAEGPSHTIRAGKLKVDRPQAVFVAME